MDDPLTARKFVFATGIECSYPVITGKDGGAQRMDELEKTFHYTYWKEDFALVRQLGLRYLRYGPPYYKIHLAPHRYDWEFTDLAFAEMRRLGIIPIVDLCHFGVPEWIGDFQNPDWPNLFSQYAAAFAARFPWVQFYTPVNEIYVCAKLSAWNGIWNERKRDDHRAFVTALKHLCKANLLAIDAIAKERPDANFIQSESAEYFHRGGEDPDILKRVQWENDRRFLSFDFLYSVSPCTEIALYLLDNGMTRDEYRWFMSHGLGDRIIMGNDFYERNEQVIVPGGAAKAAGEVFGWAAITRQYYDRYRRPVMHTETNTLDADAAPRWLWKEFFNVLHLREQGVPVLGFTWYSLTDQVDWDSALAQDMGRVNPVGLYDLQRRARPVAAAYRELLLQFGSLPLFPNSPALAFYQGARPPPSEISLRPKPQHTVEQRSPLAQRASVAIARTTDEHIDAEGIARLVRECLQRLGGIERFVQSGQTVLIKPNQTVWRLASDGCTTDPRVVAALVSLAREAGAGTVQVGECSSCGQITREVMRITGIEKAARAAGAELVYFDEVAQIEVDVARGKLIQKIPVPKPLLEADVVIACPKLKTHFLDPITGAIKLWVGAARQDTMHRLHRDTVHETVADLLTVTRPDLAVMDAIVAGEGNGPIATRGRFMGCILASDDTVALDVIAGDLAGFDGESMSFPRAAAERGVGVNRRDRIDVLGVPVRDAAVRLEPEQMENWENSYPVRIIIGDGVTMAGTVGHFKGFADFWRLEHLWQPVIALHGKPTFMMGRAEDPDYEAHLKEGKYFVLDDAALDKYKKDPRVTFIPGSPIGNEMMPAIMKALHIELPGRAIETAMKTWKRVAQPFMAVFLLMLSILQAANCPPSHLDPQQTLAKFQDLDRQAQTAFDRGQYAAAAQHYREAACLAPKSARAFYGLGIAQAAAGNFPTAREALEAAYAILPGNAMPVAMLVRVNVAMKDIEKTKEVLRNAAQRFPRDLELHSGLARFLAENQLLDLALAESLRVEQAGGSDVGSAVALAALEQTAGAYGDAIRHASAIENQASVPNAVKASAAGIAGLSYESVGQRDEAIRHLRLAIQLAPAQENSYLALAYLFEKAQMFAQAAEVLQAGRKQILGSPNLLLPLANNLVWAEQFQAGIDVLNELIAKAPDTAEAYVRLAEAYRKTSRPDLETGTLRQLARIKPDYPMIHVLTAQSLMTSDPVDYRKVLDELAQAAKSTPNDPDIFYLRGKVYAATQRYPEATAALQRAIELRPMEPGPYYQLGLVYRKLGRTQAAREALARMEHIKR